MVEKNKNKKEEILVKACICTGSEIVGSKRALSSPSHVTVCPQAFLSGSDNLLEPMQ